MKKFIIFLNNITFNILGCYYSTDSDNNIPTTINNTATIQNEEEYIKSTNEEYAIPDIQNKENYSIQLGL